MSMFHELMMRKKIPSIYKVLDWIEGTGTQYIDTGYIPTNNDIFATEVYSKIKFTGSDYQSVFFAGNGSYVIAGTFGPKDSVSVIFVKYFRIGAAAVVVLPTNSDISYKTWIKIEMSPTLTKAIVDGSTYDTNTNTYQADLDGTNNNLLLFTNYNKNYYFKGKMKSFIIKNSGATKLNLIPVRRLTDNVCGVYDTVSKTFFGNTGTGAFVGSDE